MMKRLLNVLLLVSLGMVLVLGAVFFFSYKASQKGNAELLEINSSIYQKPLQIKEGEVQEQSTQVIFFVSEETKELKEAVLEVIDSSNKRMKYIQIPANTKLNLSSKLYQKFSAIYTEMPQYFELSQLAKMFDEEKRYGYGQLIIDDVLGIETGYYTAIEGKAKDFSTYRKQLIKQHQLTSRAAIESYIESNYKNMDTNLSKARKLQLVSAYATTKKCDIIEELIKGTLYTETYEVNLVEFTNQMNER